MPRYKMPLQKIPFSCNTVAEEFPTTVVRSAFSIRYYDAGGYKESRSILKFLNGPLERDMSMVAFFYASFYDGPTIDNEIYVSTSEPINYLRALMRPITSDFDPSTITWNNHTSLPFGSILMVHELASVSDGNVALGRAQHHPVTALHLNDIPAGTYGLRFDSNTLLLDHNQVSTYVGTPEMAGFALEYEA